MILVWMIAVLVLGGLVAWLSAQWGESLPRWLALLALLLDAVLVLAAAMGSEDAPVAGVDAEWMIFARWDWIPRFGIAFEFGLDGLSLLLVGLTILLGVVAVSAAWNEISERCGFFYFNLLACLAGVLGVFLALDLFLFFVFWELMIIPMYFLIAIWGHENRAYAAIKFFIFTQASGLLMLLAIVVLAVVFREHTGDYSFDYRALVGLPLEPDLAFWLMLGFFIAFTVKLPAVPFHTWLPDAHTQAPTAGSVILAGILLKTGAYGLIRLVVPLFPEAARDFAPVAMSLGVVSILYGAKLAFAQTDLKRLIAYTSISHMGFVLVGVFAWNSLALQGTVMTLLAHGISSAALFMIAGALQYRIHTRDMRRMGGLWEQVPGMGAVTLFFSVAALGMPGLGNFIGEFLVLLGAFRVDRLLTTVAALGLVLAPIYALIIIQKVFHGHWQEYHELPDFGRREWLTMAAMIMVMIWLGIYPQSMLVVSAPVVEFSLESVGSGP